MNRLNEFQNYLVLNKNSKYTVNTCFQRMKTYFNEYPEFTQDNINSFLTKKINNNLSANTINLYIYTLKTYSEFSKIIIELPKAKRVQNKIKSYITEQELKDILVKLNILTDHADKWRVILSFMFYTGLRFKEVVNLKYEDIDLNKNQILVKNTKNHEERIIPISNKIKDMLIKYLSNTPKKENALNIKATTIKYICKVIKDNFNIDFHPHTLRHSACHYFLKLTNNNYDAVQKVMGHKNIEQTLAYSRLNDDEIMNLFHNAFKNERKTK